MPGETLSKSGCPRVSLVWLSSAVSSGSVTVLDELATYAPVRVVLGNNDGPWRRELRRAGDARVRPGRPACRDVPQRRPGRRAPGPAALAVPEGGPARVWPLHICWDATYQGQRSFNPGRRPITAASRTAPWAWCAAVGGPRRSSRWPQGRSAPVTRLVIVGVTDARAARLRCRRGSEVIERGTHDSGRTW